MIRSTTLTRGLAGWLATALAWSAACTTRANAERYDLTPGSAGTEAVFVSKAPMETFQGATKKIEGFVEIDPASIADSIGVEITVDLASLDTGIDLRNEHMCKNHLETAKYPTAVFRGARLAADHASSLEPGVPSTLQITGTLTIHGVTRPLETPVRLTLDAKTQAIEIETTFVVALADFEIPRPKVLFMKLDEKQTVTFRAAARPKP